MGRGCQYGPQGNSFPYPSCGKEAKSSLYHQANQNLHLPLRRPNAFSITIPALVS